MRVWGIGVSVLLAATAAPMVPAGDPAPAQAAPPAPKVIADFEAEDSAQAVETYGSSVRRVAPPPGGGSAFLEWSIPGIAGSAAVYLPAGDLDLAPYASLRLRARLTGGRPGSLVVRLENSRNDYAAGTVRGVGAEWKAFDIPLDSMEPEGKFDRSHVATVTFVVFRPSEGGYQLDDVQLLPPAPAPAKAPGKPQAPPAAPRKPVVVARQDFEAPESMDFVEAFHSSCERVPGDPPGGGWVLRWKLDENGKQCYFVVAGFPEDIREIRTVRFRIRVEREIPLHLEFRLQNAPDDFLGKEIDPPGTTWKEVEIKLPGMQAMGRFDPRRVREIGFVTFEPRDATVLVDDLQLVAEPGGWRRTEAEEIVAAFGKDRARQVTKVSTPHFDLFTDSTAALSKFPHGLEDAYGFVRKSLGVGEMEEKLPVYILQNPTLYVDFCVRMTGWTRKEAEQTAGHGSGRYFATYYQAPETPVVVHELTHSIFHRTEGPWGGSWFQEGVAVYVEHLWQKHTAAELFAARLRSGQFVALRKFTAMPVLAEEKDVRGGAGSVDSLYLQAGAFYEFLLRGPPAARWPSIQHDLATVVRKDAETGAVLERGLGTSLEEIEKAWVAWGSNPAKGK